MPTALQTLSLEPTAAPSIPGLVPVRQGDHALAGIAERAAVAQAASIGDIDYVFFRRFADERSSQVSAYVIDNGDERLNEGRLTEIHKRVWLNGTAPLLFVGWRTRVDVLSCARGPDFWRDGTYKYDPAEQITVSGQISKALEEKQRRFSAARLGDGTFWDDPANTRLARADKAAHRRLINAVVEADRDLKGDRDPVLRRLLLLTVLIKYLEDRGVFPDAWFDRHQKNASTFFEVLKRGTADNVRGLLESLERKFNGDVFTLPEAEDNRLTNTELHRFAELVESRTIQGQRYLWEQYSFRHIPVEVISHLYQRFAQKRAGAVFTPPFLASLLLDFGLPYEGLTGSERILDPTCGSGVFLVGAFRRLVHYWQSQNRWAQPDVQTLKRILKRSIFGVELQEEAVHLTAFSLALAMCDALQPNVIWRELRFDRLVGSNLLAGDFFEHEERLRSIGGEEGFSLVIGNPPFQSKFTEAAKKANEAADRSRVPVPDKQIAHLIAEQAMALLENAGRMCLVQPAGFLYNENARPFQRSFLAANQTETILDFTSIRNLFDGADPKTVALLVKKHKPPAGHQIRHLTFRRTFSVRERIGFELDHYDRHAVPQQTAEAHSWVWRANLLGGGRLRPLAERMDQMPSLRQFVEAKGWDYGEGFIAATGGRREPAAWLTGKPFLPTRAFTEQGIDESKITTVKETKFRSAYTEARYSGPIVMVRENEKLPCTFRQAGFLAYKAKIVGIHADSEELGALRSLYESFQENRSVLRALCLILGTQALVGKATAILKRDIDALPWPANGAGWNLAEWERILCEDVVGSMPEFVRLGQNSKLLRLCVTVEDLAHKAGTFVSMLGTVYENLRSLRSITLDGIACQAFCFGKEPELSWSGDWAEPLRRLIYVEQGEVLRTVRVLRFYERNVILIVKPDRLRYWIRSTAIRDADETLADLRQQGY